MFTVCFRNTFKFKINKFTSKFFDVLFKCELRLVAILFSILGLMRQVIAYVGEASKQVCRVVESSQIKVGQVVVAVRVARPAAILVGALQVVQMFVHFAVRRKVVFTEHAKLDYVPIVAVIDQA